MVQRPAGHRGRFCLRLAPPGGSRHGLGVLSGAGADRECDGRGRRARCLPASWEWSPPVRTLWSSTCAPRRAYLLSLLTNAYLCPIYEPAVKQWGDSLDATGAPDFKRALPFVRTSHQRAHHARQESILLGRWPRAIDKSDLPHRRRQRRHHEPISSRQSRLYRSIQRLRNGTAEASPGEPSRALPQFCDGDVQLQLRETSLCREIAKLRLALNMAVDREILVNYVEHGVGIPAYNMMPPLEGYDPAIPGLGETFSGRAPRPRSQDCIRKRDTPTAIRSKWCSPMRAAGPERAASWKRYPRCG